jgi:hypothetical protein
MTASPYAWLGGILVLVFAAEKVAVKLSLSEEMLRANIPSNKCKQVAFFSRDLK